MIKQLTSKENLNAAYLQVYRNKGAGGVDGKSVQTLKSTLQANGKRYIEQVERGVYQPSPILGVEIPKSNGKRGYSEYQPLQIGCFSKHYIKYCNLYLR